MSASLDKLTKDLSRIKNELAESLSGIRGNRANPAMVDTIEVEVYGSRMKLRDVAHIAATDSRLITIQPWDAGQVDTIAKQLGLAGLGVNPVVDSGVIRLPLPPLSEERREELVKIVKSRLEEARVRVRQSRHETKESLERSEKSGEIAEDELKRQEGLLQREVDKVTNELEELAQAKEQEVMTV